MATKLGSVAGIPIVKKTNMGYILKNGRVIEDTFAEMLPTVEITPAKPPFFYDFRAIRKLFKRC